MFLLDFKVSMIYKNIFGIITLSKDAIRRIGGYDVSKMDEYGSSGAIGVIRDGCHDQLREGQL